MPLKRDAMPLKRDAMPLTARRYATAKKPALGGPWAGRYATDGATLSRWWEPHSKLRLALGAVLEAALGDDPQPLQLAYSAG